MTLKNTEKNKDAISELGKSIAPILVVNNASLKPYIESFHYSPENLYQQPLGILVGFFEIKEYSEDSAYIVNFLTSVLKKEYFINPKRTVEESLDSALHKVNLALSELAKHGNINWLGKLDGVVCVLEKNNLHFGVAGQAKVFLARNTHFIEISEELASKDQELHPLKTFVNVSSGRLEKNDRILITSEDIFRILTVQQLGKNIQRFEGEKLIQFLKTAMTNELEMASIIVIDMKSEETAKLKKPKIAIKKQIASTTPVNVFSEQAFKEKQKAANAEPVIIRDFPEEDETEEYTDQKTGHIYIQGENATRAETSAIKIYMTLARENLGDFTFATKSFVRKQAASIKKSVTKAIENRKKKIRELKEQKEHEMKLREIELAELAEKQAREAEEARKLEEIRLAEVREKAKTQHVAIIDEAEENLPISKPIAEEKEESVKEAHEKNQSSEKEIGSVKTLSLQEKIARARIEMEQQIPIHTSKSSMDVSRDSNKASAEINEKAGEIEEEVDIAEDSTQSKLESYWNTATTRASDVAKKEKKFMKKIIPDFSKISSLFEQLSIKQKLITLGIIVLIFVVPYIFIKLDQPEQKPSVENKAQIPSLAQLLAAEKNIILNTTLQQVNNSNVVGIEIFDGSPYYITKNSVTGSLDSNAVEHPLPTDSGNVITTAFMKDLNLIFMFTDQRKMISFSPISQQFKSNTIEIPETTETKFIETYLTYLYMIDEKNNQIYRYPRAEGGFGTRTSWLKDNTLLSGIKDVTLDENIYFVSNNTVTKLFKNEKQEFNLETSATPINFDKIYTTSDLKSLYVLDKKNARLVQFAKDGSLTKQYFNETLKDVATFSVDEKNMKAYFATPQGVQSLGL